MRRLLLVMLLAVVATGCFKADVAIKVKDDGSGEIRTIEAIDRTTLHQLGGDGSSGADLVPAPEDVPPGVNAKPYASGSYEGVEVNTSFNGIDELSGRLADVDITLDIAAQAITGGTTEGALSGLQIEPTAAGWSFHGSGFGASSVLPPQWGDVSKQIKIRLAVTLPGHAVESAHNADHIQSGHTFVWNLSPGDARRQIYAATVKGPSASPRLAGALQWLVVGLLVLAAGAATGFALSQRRRRPAHEGQPSGGNDSGKVPVRSPTGPSGWPTRPPIGDGIVATGASNRGRGAAPLFPSTPPVGDPVIPAARPAPPRSVPPGVRPSGPPSFWPPAQRETPPPAPWPAVPALPVPALPAPTPPVPTPAPAPPLPGAPSLSGPAAASTPPSRVGGPSQRTTSGDAVRNQLPVPGQAPPAWANWGRPALDMPSPGGPRLGDAGRQDVNLLHPPRPWFDDQRRPPPADPTSDPPTVTEPGAERGDGSSAGFADRATAPGIQPRRPSDLPPDPAT